MNRSILIASIAGLAMWLTSCTEDESANRLNWGSDDQFTEFNGQWEVYRVDLIEKADSLKTEIIGEDTVTVVVPYYKVTQPETVCDLSGTSLHPLVHFNRIQFEYSNGLNYMKSETCVDPGNFLIKKESDLYTFFSRPDATKTPSFKTKLIDQDESTIALEVTVTNSLEDDLSKRNKFAIVFLRKI